MLTEPNFHCLSGSGVLEKVIQIAEPFLSGRIVVLGAGQGSLEHKLLGLGVPAERISAVDVNPKQYKVSAVDCQHADLNHSVPFDDNSFDVCFSTEVIEHLQNPYNLITEAHRIVKPGGRFFLTTPNVHSIQQKIRFLFSDQLGWFFERDYLGSGHLHPIFDWWLKRMIRDKFEIECYTSQSFHLRIIPYIPAIPMPFRHRLFAVNNIYGMRRLASC